MELNMHTPGPWSLEEVASDSGRIKHLCPVEDKSGLSLLTVVEHEGVKFAAVYNDADARLIAAAPELLDALQAVMSVARFDYNTGDETHRAIMLAESAIARATGAQP